MDRPARPWSSTGWLGEVLAKQMIVGCDKKAMKQSSALTLELLTVLDVAFPVTGLTLYVEGEP